MRAALLFGLIFLIPALASAEATRTLHQPPPTTDYSRMWPKRGDWLEMTTPDGQFGSTLDCVAISVAPDGSFSIAIGEGALAVVDAQLPDMGASPEAKIKIGAKPIASVQALTVNHDTLAIPFGSSEAEAPTEADSAPVDLAGALFNPSNGSETLSIDLPLVTYSVSLHGLLQTKGDKVQCEDYAARVSPMTQKQASRRMLDRLSGREPPPYETPGEQPPLLFDSARDLPTVNPLPQPALANNRPLANSRQLLNTLEKLRADTQKAPPPAHPDPLQGGAPATGGSSADSNTAKLSADQRMALGNHVRACWTYDPDNGMDQMRVLLRVQVDAEGVARAARVAPADKARMARDPAFRAFAERAARAVLSARCANLPLPRSMLGEPHTIDFLFSPL